jgi:uncharacterized membrane-anchored protein
MAALRELFTTDIGLLSLFVIVFIIGMGFWLYRFFTSRMREDAARRSTAAAGPTATRPR